MRHLTLYLDLFRLQLLGMSYFRSDFWLGIAASVLQNGATLAVLWLIFRQVPSLGGWTVHQSMVLYGFFSLSVGLANLLGSGLRELPQMVLQGELDGILVLPVSPYVRLLPRFSFSALGDTVVAAAVLAVASGEAGVRWTPAAVAYAMLAVACGTAVLLGFLTLLYALSFWIPYRTLMQGVEGLVQLSRFPVTIYPRWMRAAITWVLPVAFASYYPAAVLTSADLVPYAVGLLALPAAAGMLGAGYLVWKWGLRRYEGAGS